MQKSLTFAILLSTLMASTPLAAQINVPERFVQIRTLDFENGTLELHNFGSATEFLNGWRFCSHDENQDRQYSATAGLNGRMLGPGESLFVHYNNDASAGNEIDISTIGGNFALPFDTNGAYAIQIFFQTPFSNGNNIADHVQVSRFGADDTRADERSDEAENGGVWADQSEWVPVVDSTLRVVLKDASSNNELHSASDYENEFSFLLGDVNCDDVVNLLDVVPFIDALGGGGAFSQKADVNLDGAINLLDVSRFIEIVAGN